MPCTLCTPSGDIVYEDDDAYVAVHEDWAVPGHVMIVAKRHVENASSLDENAWLRIAGVWHRTERALLTLTGAERCVAMKLGILTPHLHIHLYPVPARWTREQVFAAIDGKTRVDRDERFLTNLKALLTPAPH